MGEKEWCVYMHTNKINNKKYIGISKNPIQRWGTKGHRYKKQNFGRAISKYGWDNFTHDILFSGLTEDEALNKEKELIMQYNTYNSKFGYNITKGGDLSGGCVSNQKKVYQYSLDGKYIACYDSIALAESIYGKGISCCINNRSKTSNGYQWFDEYKGEFTQKQLSREEAIAHSQYKEVFQYSLDGKFIRKYNSIKEVSEETGYERTGITKCMSGEQKTAHNYRWFSCYLGEKIDSVNPYNYNAKEIYQYSLDGEFLCKYNSMKHAIESVGRRIVMDNKKIKKSVGYIWSFEMVDKNTIKEVI